MNPLSRIAPALDAALFGDLTRQRAGVAEATVRGFIQTAVAAVGDYGERMEQRWTLTVAASADVRIGDTVTRADPAGVFTLVQLDSNNGYIAVYALRKEAT